MGHLEEGRVVVLDAQLAAHRAHVARRAPQLVPRQVRVQVVPARAPSRNARQQPQSCPQVHNPWTLAEVWPKRMHGAARQQCMLTELGGSCQCMLAAARSVCVQEVDTHATAACIEHHSTRSRGCLPQQHNSQQQGPHSIWNCSPPWNQSSHSGHDTLLVDAICTQGHDFKVRKTAHPFLAKPQVSELSR